LFSTPEHLFDRVQEALRSRDLERALHDLQHAESLGHEADLCAGARWNCFMLLGMFEAAWRESDAISRRGSGSENELWDGEPVQGKRVMVRCLHGYGDTIQFLRYAGSLRERGASRVVAQTHPEMVSLVERIRCVDEVVTWSNDLSREDWDQQIEVTELPRVFRASPETIPRDIPYIDIDDCAVVRSREHLGGGARPRVGLLWASSNWNPDRCMQLADFQPLLEARGIDLYSFQRGAERAELFQVAEAGRIHDTAVHSPHIVDTAADLVNMDLLITVDTMVAHLAGALGRPVWTLLPFEADWRWMIDRSDSPWYPTMRLFRQRTQGAWHPVVAEVVSRLTQQYPGS
jgi:hypothetical protein